MAVTTFIRIEYYLKRSISTAERSRNIRTLILIASLLKEAQRTHDTVFTGKCMSNICQPIKNTTGFLNSAANAVFIKTNIIYYSGVFFQICQHSITTLVRRMVCLDLWSIQFFVNERALRHNTIKLLGLCSNNGCI